MNGILTYTGKVIDPLNVNPDDICIEDIAHGLSLLCRYNGQCDIFYSVAEHCITMATYPGFRKWNPLVMLLHDAAEAYIGDIIRPIKLLLPEFKRIENDFLHAIAFKLITKRLWYSDFDAIKEPDNIMQATEAFFMMPDEFFNRRKDISKSMVDISIPFYCLDPLEAERRYLRFYRELRNTI